MLRPSEKTKIIGLLALMVLALAIISTRSHWTAP